MEFVHPDDREATIDGGARSLDRGQELVYFENRYFHKDGTLRWLLWTVDAVPRAARHVRRGARHHRAQGRRRNARPLRARSRSRAPRARGSDRAAGATGQGARSVEAPRRRRGGNQERVSREHEPRDPHAAQRHPRDDDAGAADAADGRAARLPRRRSSRRPTSLLEIINDILDFSKIEARRLELERMPSSSCARRSAMRPSCSPCAPPKKGSSSPAISPPTCPRLLLGDAGRLRQVLLNMLGNAIKFTAAGRSRAARAASSTQRRDRVHAALLRQRHRHRHPAGQAGADLPGIHAGRQLDDAPLRRDRPRPRDRAAARRADGRPDVGRERGRQGQHVSLHRAFGTAAVASGGAGRRPPPGARRPARPRRRRQRHQPPHPRRDARQLAHEADDGERRARQRWPRFAERRRPGSRSTS